MKIEILLIDLRVNRAASEEEKLGERSGWKWWVKDLESQRRATALYANTNSKGKHQVADNLVQAHYVQIIIYSTMT